MPRSDWGRADMPTGLNVFDPISHPYSINIKLMISWRYREIRVEVDMGELTRQEGGEPVRAAVATGQRGAVRGHRRALTVWLVVVAAATALLFGLPVALAGDRS